MARWSLIIVIVLAFVLVAGGVYASRIADQAGVGAAAMAKVVCSCVFVAGRTLEACRADDPPGFEDISVSIDPTAKTATGTVLGLVSRRASYSEQFGCTLDPP